MDWHVHGKSLFVLRFVEFFRSFEEVRDRICYRLIRKERNEELLKDIPYIDFLDLAIPFSTASRTFSVNSSILIFSFFLRWFCIFIARLHGSVL